MPRRPRANTLLLPQHLPHIGSRGPISAVACLAWAAASALPPTRNSHSVATATASHRRSARCGASIRVCCHCHPPLLLSLKPCSIQLRKPYQEASPCPGARSLRISHGSLCPAPHQPSNVPAICRLGVEK